MTKHRIQIQGRYHDEITSVVLDDQAQRNLITIKRYYETEVVIGSRTTVSAVVRAALAYYAKAIRAEWERRNGQEKPA